MPEKLYSPREAAAYLGITESTMQFYVHTRKILTPDGRLGRNLYFYQETLDKFKASRKPRGRPDRPSTFQAHQLTTPEACEFLGIDDETLRRMVKKHMIPVEFVSGLWAFDVNHLKAVKDVLEKTPPTAAR